MNKTLGKEAVLEVGGKRYTLSRFDRSIADRFLEYVRKTRPDPIDAIRDKLKGFPEAIQHRMIDKAMEKASQPLGYESPEYRATLATPEGSYHLLYLLFQKHHPDISEKQAVAIYDESVKEHGYGYIEEKLKEAEGQMPVNRDEVKRETLREFGLLEAGPEKKG